MIYKLKKITEDEIKKAWDILWPGREQIYMSDMTYPEIGFDQTIYEKYTPTLWGLYDGELMIGSNSGHKTSEDYYRGRGVWVHEDYRRKGISNILWAAVADQGKIEGCTYLWCLPRKPTFDHVLEFGFERVSDWIRYDYGENAYALYHLDTHELVHIIGTDIR